MMLVPATFRLAPFHVDANSRTSGRRIVLHEFPKRDTPYAEDMGRSARRFPVTGYVIGPDYQIWRELLVLALEAEGPGLFDSADMVATRYDPRASARIHRARDAPGRRHGRV